MGLFAESGGVVTGGKTAFGLHDGTYGRDENTAGKVESVAVAEDLLEMLHGAKATKLAGGESDIADRAVFEAFGKGEHIDEELEDARHASVVLGNDNDETR